MRRDIALIVLAAWVTIFPATAFSQTPRAAKKLACPDSRIPTPEHSVTVAELTFAGEPHFKIANLQQIGADLKQQTYTGPTDGEVSGLEEMARRVWQDEGFFQVQVHSEATVLTSSPANARVAVTLHVDEGKQYRLSKITFKNNRALSNPTAMRSLFPIKDGEIFKRSVIGQGLENLRLAYRDFGYVNATSVPDTRINDKAGTISLTVDVDEGMQFFITDIHLLGASGETAENLLREAPLQRGQAYNQRLAEDFFSLGGGLLPPGISRASRIHLDLDEKNGMLEITFDLRKCGQADLGFETRLRR